MREQNVDNSPSRGTKPPTPMTANELKSYLEFAIEDYSVTDQPVLINSKPILKGQLQQHCVTLLTEHRHGDLAHMTTRSFKRYLGMATGGMFTSSGEAPVMYGDEFVVNAKVEDGCVVLETSDQISG